MSNLHQLYAHLFVGEEAEVVVRAMMVGVEVLPATLARRLGVPVASVQEALTNLRIHQVVTSRAISGRVRDGSAYRLNGEFADRVRRIIEKVQKFHRDSEQQPVELWRCACATRPPMDYYAVSRDCSQLTRAQRAQGIRFYCRFCNTEPVSTLVRPMSVETRTHDNRLINVLSGAL